MGKYYLRGSMRKARRVEIQLCLGSNLNQTSRTPGESRFQRSSQNSWLNPIQAFELLTSFEAFKSQPHTTQLSFRFDPNFYSQFLPKLIGHLKVEVLLLSLTSSIPLLSLASISIIPKVLLVPILRHVCRKHSNEHQFKILVAPRSHIGHVKTIFIYFSEIHSNSLSTHKTKTTPNIPKRLDVEDCYQSLFIVSFGFYLW
jgi:hypothetical protein